jgi:hypothetical protein
LLLRQLAVSKSSSEPAVWLGDDAQTDSPIMFFLFCTDTAPQFKAQIFEVYSAPV